MNPRVLSIWLCLACCAVSSCATTVDEARLLHAMRQVEEWDGRDGARGERGPWQITGAVWSMHMPGRPFAEARHEGPARECALRHLAWLRAQLRARGCDDGAFMVALTWNAGLARTLSGKAPMRAYNHALRVENLHRHRP
ncbi:MAG: hypothetical protein Q8J78_06735 [Moraxellaceae bacterium]|nr:hypothetical protein [Moraxellaceae bacterium]